MTFRPCSVDGCPEPHRAKGWCKRHYYMLRPERCSQPGCTKRRDLLGLCAAHAKGRERPGHPEASRICPECAMRFVAKTRSRYCSVWCKSQAKRSPLRKAVEAQDSAGILAAARAGSVVTESGCWEWQFATTQAGYGVIGQGGKGGLVHRHVAHAALGIRMTTQPVHHKCANRKCCNPEHLQLTTARENVAEMLARSYYERRIMDLESALAEIAPEHPLLNAAGQYTTNTVTLTGSAT